MIKKAILLFVLLFLLMIPTAFAWSLFGDDVEENTENIYISDLETEWWNSSDGYKYKVSFDVRNISSSHDIRPVISFYNFTGDLVKGYNLSGDMADNLTLPLRYGHEFYRIIPYSFWGYMHTNDFQEISYIKIRIFDFTENKVLYDQIEPFNMSNLWDPNEEVDYSDEKDSSETSDSSNSDTSEKSTSSKSDVDYDFFKQTDYDGDGLISFDEFSEISYIFTENSFWDGYSTEEILQSEWDRANDDGDNYLTFEEFRQVI